MLTPLEWALEYIGRGWPVLPLYPVVNGKCACPDSVYKVGPDPTKWRCSPGKHPYANLHRGLKDATLDPKQATLWWGRMWPNAGIGISLIGAKLLDVAPDGVVDLADFIARGLPETLTFRSGGGEGHQHSLYRLPDGGPQARLCLPTRYDIMSDGYCVAPPTLHWSGGQYTWLEYDSVTEPAEPPLWALELLLDQINARTSAATVSVPGDAILSTNGEPPLEIDLDVWDGLSYAQDRSGGLWAIAGELAQAGANEATIVEALRERDQTLGWHKYANRADADKQYLQAARRQLANVMPRIHLNGGATPTPMATVTSTWSSPEDFIGLRPAPRLPLECFAPALRNYVHSIAWRKQAAPDYALWSVEALLGSFIGRRARVRLKRYDTWAEPATLWVGNIGDPSTLKTPIQDEAVELREDITRLLLEEYEREHADWEAELQADPDSKRKEPQPRVCWTTLATTEKLADLSNDARSRGLVLIRDELAGLIFDLNRYRGGQGGDRQFFLQAYSGGAFATHLITRKASPVSDLLISIVGGIQPGRAREIFSADVHRDDGFAARFLSIWPEAPTSMQWIDEAPDETARQAVRDAAIVLFETDWELMLEPDARRLHPYCRLSEQAVAVFADWSQKNRARLRSGHFDGQLAFRIGKYDGFVGRLILINHLLEWALRPSWERTREKARVVTSDVVERMLTVVEQYVLPMEERVYAAYAISEAAQAAERVLGWLRNDVGRNPGRTTITAREARRVLRQDTPEAAEMAVEWLCSRNWLHEQTPRLSSRGRRGSQIFEVNPDVLQRWKAQP